jgi:predicted phage terminase large subunit-like protein
MAAFNPREFDPRSVDAEAQLIDLDRADFEESLYQFLKAAWRYIDPAAFKDSWAVDAICEHLQAIVDGQIRRLIINCPPRIGKSNCVSVAFPAWIWAQPIDGPVSGPGVPLLHASHTDKLALRDSVKCRRLIESPWYQARWGHRFQLTSDQNTKSRFTNDKGGERLITSVESGVTGEGGNCFVAGTMVSTPEGQVPIEALRAGDEVLSFDTLRGKVVKSFVLATSKRIANGTCTLREVSGRRFDCTPDHPVFSPGRGFVSAGEMGSGDRLLVTEDSPQKRTDSDVPASDLRQLRKASQETSVFAEKGAEAGEPGLLLRYQVPRRASLVQKLSRVREMQKGICEAQRALLRRSQAGYRELVHKGAAYLRSMWRRVSEVRNEQAILLAQMCRYGPLFAHDGCQQLKVQIERDGAVFESFPANAQTNSGTRRALLYELWRIGQENTYDVPSADITSGSPHRRGYAKQSAIESNHALRQLPHDSPHCRIAYIEEVTRNRCQAVEVYDIQVDICSNFFADGILVHNCIIIDDPNDASDVASEASLQKTVDWWQNSMPTRANDPATSAWIIIQQRVAEDDLTGHIISNEAEGWTHLCLPGRYEPERSFHTSIGWKDPRTYIGELLWPERFSEEEMRRLEKRPWLFAGQIQQRPEPKGGGLIKSDWWIKFDRDEYDMRHVDFVLGVVDTAFTTSELNDPSGMMVWMIYNDDKPSGLTQIVDPEGNAIRVSGTYSELAPKVLLAYAWDEYLELHDLVNKVHQTCVKYKVNQLVIENKASGISVAQEIRRLFSREKYGVELFDPKSQDKAARLISVQHLFAEGMIHAPDKAWADKVIKQVGQFPKSKHDEYVDLTSMGLRKLRDMGLLIRQVERESEIEADKAYRGREEPLYAV